MGICLLGVVFVAFLKHGFNGRITPQKTKIILQTIHELRAKIEKKFHAIPDEYINQSRICGEGVSLGLFPSIEKCTHRTLLWCRMAVENFVRIV